MAYRILSLDGGGTWALIEVKALIDIYGPATTGHTVLKDFDLVAANSGGSIVLAALACDLPLQQILADFLDPDWRAKLFVPLPWYSKLNPISLFVPQPKYSAEAKLQGLQQVLKTAGTDYGNTQLSALPALWGGKPHLVVTSFDYDRERAVIFRSNTSSPTKSGAPALPVTLAEAVHASSNAPIKYFDAPAAFDGRRFWDGAMAGLNNPVLVAVLEALAGGVPQDQIRVRSIGTGSVFLPISGLPVSLLQPKADPGLNDIGKAANCILDDPPDEAAFAAYTYLDGRFAPPFPIGTDIVVRINPLVQPVKDTATGNWIVPGSNLPKPPLSNDEFETLVTLAIDPDQDQVNLIVRFCDAWLNDIFPNQPIRANSDTLDCEIGHRWFSAAKAAW